LDEIVRAFVHSAQEQEKVRNRIEEEQRVERILTEKRMFIKRIEMQAACWQRATAIRNFVAESKRAHLSGLLSVASPEAFERWVQTAETLANQMDPFTGNWSDRPPEFTDYEGYKDPGWEDSPKLPAYAPWWFVKRR
jgi:hypothetical protein